MLDGLGRYPGMGHWGIQNLPKEFSIPYIVLLVHPESLEEVMGMLGLGGIPLAGPLLTGRYHILRLTLTELDPRPVANSIHRMLKVLHKLIEGSAVHLDILLKRLALVDLSLIHI